MCSMFRHLNDAHAMLFASALNSKFYYELLKVGAVHCISWVTMYALCAIAQPLQGMLCSTVHAHSTNTTYGLGLYCLCLLFVN